MTPDEREQMAILCERIAKERDAGTYIRYVRELSRLLKMKYGRLPNITRKLTSKVIFA